MTRRLFNEDSMIKEFKATVTTCEPFKEHYAVTLSETAFFPTGGGQEYDRGTLFILPGTEESQKSDGNIVTNKEEMHKNYKSCEIMDVRNKEEEVLHIVGTEIPVGTVVYGFLDWSARFDKMQQHTGEHIVSGIICEKYGYTNVGFHLGADTVTFDFNEELTREQLDEIEVLANLVVSDNREVEVLYPSESELKDMDYRSKIEIKEQVRVVRIPGCDSCACCAPHVPFTGMVGLIKLIDVVKHRGGVRITMACGMRALMDYQTKSSNTKMISQILSVKEVDTAAGVEKLNRDYQNIKYELNKLQDTMVTIRSNELLKDYKIADNPKLILVENDFTQAQAKTLVNLLLEGGVEEVLVFTQANDTTYQFVAGTISGDVRYISNKLREEFGAKGGGNGKMIQGSVVGDITVLYGMFQKKP